MDKTPGIERFSLSGRVGLVTGAPYVTGQVLTVDAGRSVAL